MRGEQPAPRRHVTIYDVANAAGVAPSTVSRALTRPGRVSADTARHVLEVAGELGYRVRSSRRSHATARTKVLVVCVPGLESPSLRGTLPGIETEAALSGHSLVIVNGRNDAAAAKLSLERALPLADGIVMIAPRSPDAVVQHFAQARPLVVVHRVVREVPSVVQDGAEGMAQLVGHLRGLGHRCVGYVGGPDADWGHAPGWEVLAKACRAAGMAAHRIRSVEPTARAGFRVVEPWMAQRTSAVVCFNEEVALGFSHGVRERGLRVPEDVSIVGVDTKMGGPPGASSLSTLAVAADAQGAIAVRRVLAELDGSASGAAPILVPMRLVRGASTGPASRRC